MGKPHRGEEGNLNKATEFDHLVDHDPRLRVSRVDHVGEQPVRLPSATDPPPPPAEEQLARNPPAAAPAPPHAARPCPPPVGGRVLGA